MVDMAIATGRAATTNESLTIYIRRALEALWLLTAAFVPLIFVPKEFFLSEAVNAYVEVPKTTGLRTLVGIMTVLVIFEWVLKGGLHKHYSLTNYSARLWDWVTEQPSRWVVFAAVFYVLSAIISTLLSQNFYISVWGEVSGQFGYSGYTTVSYFLLFAIVASHLQTRDQLWRLLGVIVATGVLVGLYGIIQHYGGDPLDLGEAGSERVSAMMANPVFAGSTLVITTLFTIGVGLAALNHLGWSYPRLILWVILVAIQMLAVYWTGSRGSFFLGVPAGLMAFLFLAPFASRVGAAAARLTAFVNSFSVIASALLITLAVILLTPSPADRPGSGQDATAGADQVQERLTSIRDVAVRGGVSYRFDIWEGSWNLILDRPWFEYEDLSISYLRPLVGYGPELFKYTFPLESPLGGLLSQSHNFFLHHWVEQGVLGVLSSLFLFIAFFVVGLAQLWFHRNTYSTTHKWILVALLATMAGRLIEGMVGVNRESDLVLFWFLLAIFVVLPPIMGSEPEKEAAHSKCPSCGFDNKPEARFCDSCGTRLGAPTSEVPHSRASRRERRNKERQARRSGTGYARQLGMAQLFLLSLVMTLVVFIGWLTWDKNVDYAWAAYLAASARDQFSEGQFQEAEIRMSQATDKAPDVPIYYHNLAGIYDAYGEFATANPDSNLPPCKEVFNLETASPSAVDRPYAACGEESYLVNLAAYRKNTTSPQAKLVLANSTLSLALQGYRGEPEVPTYPCRVSCDVEALLYYEELTAMIPASWPLKNALGAAYVRLGIFEPSLDPLDASLAITGNGPQSAQALYLKGVSYENLGRLPEAIQAFQQNLTVSSDNSNAAEVRRRLLNDITRAYVQQEQSQQAIDALEAFLNQVDSSPDLAAALYLQGLAYQQLGQLEQAIDSLESSLEREPTGSNAANVHRELAKAYAAIGNQAKADEHTQLLEELTQQ